MSAVHGFPANAWGQHLGWTLIQFLWQGTVLSLLFAIVRGSLRRRMTAHARYVLACATLGLMVLAPIWTFLVRVSVPLAPAWPVPSPDAWPAVLPWLVIAWLSGVVVCSTRLVGGWRVTARLRSVGVRPAQMEWQRRLEDLIRRVGISRPVRLLVSSLVEIPVVVGWWRPVILVPVGALTGLPPAHVEALLAHELAHIRRLDYLINILQSLAEAILFYHPAVWWVSGQIRAERELCCDDVAVAASGDALTYAHALASLESHRPAHAHALAATGGSLLDRIRRLLGQTPPASHALPGPAAAGTMCLLWLVGIGAVSTHAAARVPPSPLPMSSSPAANEATPTPRPILSALLFGPVGPAPALPSAEQQPKATPAQTANARTASLAGVVTAADSGNAISRAHVTIAPESGPTQSVMTDEAGHYVFTNLSAGRYTITASKTGYFDAIFGQKAPSHPGTPVPLADGQTRDHIDLRLPRGGVISGVVVDEHGDPSPDTEVRAMRVDAHTGEKTLVMQASTQTDDHGAYRLHNLPHGTYLVVAVPRLDTDSPPQNGGRAGGGGRGGGRAVAPDPAPPSSPGQAPRLDYVPVYFPGTTNAASATAVTIGLGEEKPGNDIPLQLVPLAKLEGTIAGIDAPTVDASFRVGGSAGPDVPGTFVNTTGTLPSLQLVSADAVPGQPRPGGSNMIMGNHFTFGSVAPGRYVIQARGSRPNPNGGSGSGPNGRIGIWGDLPVVVDGHDQNHLMLAMQDGVTIGGHLDVDANAIGTPPDFGRMFVTLLLPGQTAGGGPVVPPRPRGLVDSSGRFSIQGVVPGTYTLSVGTLNFAGSDNWAAKSVLVDGQDALDFGLTVHGGDSLSDLDVTLTNAATEINGTLSDATGKPTADDAVIVFAADAKYWAPEGRRIQATRPGTDGKFTFRGLPAGDYLIAAVADIDPGQWYDPALLQQLKGSGTPIHLSDGDHKTQDLRLAR